MPKKTYEQKKLDPYTCIEIADNTIPFSNFKLANFERSCIFLASNAVCFSSFIVLRLRI
jgi:hypothetical protein